VSVPQLWDAIVIGAGPTGCVAAHQLAQRSREVLLVDKARFPRAKVCGCCINAGAVRALDEMGLGDAVRRCDPLPIEHFTLHSGGQATTMTLPGGIVLDRATLDATLAGQAREAGAQFHDHTSGRVQPMDANSGYRRVRLSGDDSAVEAQAGLVIAADGLGGTSLRRLGAFAWRLERAGPVGLAGQASMDGFTPPTGTIAMALAAGGYVGRVQLPDGTTDFAASLEPAAIKQAGGRDALVRSIIEAAHGTSSFDPGRVSWQGTPPLRRARSVAGDRLLAAGDAAGYVEPFTGEGIGWAIAAGRAAAEVADRAIRDGWHPALASLYRRRYRRLRRAQWPCRAITAAIRHPRVVGLGTRLLPRVPLLAGPIVRCVTGGSESSRHRGARP